MLMLMSPESRVPKSHPIRRIKVLADEALAVLSPTFDKIYSTTGRPSIPPERLLKAGLLMTLFTVRSERQFCEQLDYNLLYRWFLDMDMTEWLKPIRPSSRTTGSVSLRTTWQESSFARSSSKRARRT